MFLPSHYRKCEKNITHTLLCTHFDYFQLNHKEKKSVVYSLCCSMSCLGTQCYSEFSKLPKIVPDYMHYCLKQAASAF